MTSKPNLKEIRAKLLAGVDPDEEEPNDDGILDTLVFLNALGFCTWCSCAGHDVVDGDENEYPNCGPYVEIVSSVHGDDFTEAEAEARAKRFESGTLTDEDIRISEEQRQALLVLQDRLIVLLDEFYRDRSISECVRLVVSRPHTGFNGFTFASQGAWVKRMGEERRSFLQLSQREMADFTGFLRLQLSSE